MNCDLLAFTGLSPMQGLFAMAFICLVTGALLCVRRSRRTFISVTAVLLLAALGITASTGTSAAQATTQGCTPPIPGPNSEVAAVQTAQIIDMAPGTNPATIKGVVSNHSRQTRYITAVTVSITAVTKDPQAAAGPCDKSDYTLLDVRMPLGQVLPSGRTVDFAGALISFNNKSVNQDACKNATVSLRYDVT